MKQYIEISQLTELSDKGKDRLRKWCENKLYFEYRDTSMPSDPVKNPSSIIKEIIPLSIGQMIEFLDEQNKGWKFDWRIEFKEFSAVSLVDYGIEVWYPANKKMVEKYNLCDALWEAVKEILENNL
ncbi:MAG: hypothetical protein NUV58_04830 [Candidatus Roizmanbacteria bacterium]|nr:hypothetical protein [Candidatus Roizmanbacteria bacterium]